MFNITIAEDVTELMKLYINSVAAPYTKGNFTGVRIRYLFSRRLIQFLPTLGEIFNKNYLIPCATVSMLTISDKKHLSIRDYISPYLEIIDDDNKYQNITK